MTPTSKHLMRLLFRGMTVVLGLAFATTAMAQTVALTSPANNSTYGSGSTITFSASVTGTVTKVRYKRSGQLMAMGTSTVAPSYVYTDSISTPGTYSITAEAMNGTTVVATSAARTITITAAPSVTWVAPANNASLSAPASFSLEVNATDSDGTISQVAFYADGAPIGTDTTSPYQATFTSSAVGSHALTAVATDNSGNSTTSATRTVSITGNAAPTVTWVSPASGALQPTPASFALEVTAIDDGAVSLVTFYADGASIGTDSTAPYQATFNSTSVGPHALTAVATDNAGASTTSATRSVTVTATNAAPAVSLTSPSNGASLTAPAVFNLAASASDTDGSIASVAFYADGVALGSPDTSAPYQAMYSTSAAGSHALTAVATDNLGATQTSAATSVTVVIGPLTVTRRYVYDDFERLCKTIDPEAGATVIDYDAAGNIAWTASGLNLPSTLSCDRTDPSVDAVKVTRSYDEMNRLKAVVTPGNAANVTTTYTRDGLIETLVAANGVAAAYPVTTTYSYNKRRLLVGETSGQPTPPAYTFSLTYGYDANGNLSSLLYPDNMRVDYAPDALGRATQVVGTKEAVSTPFATGIGYYPNGAISGFTYGNGVGHTMTQNARLLPWTSRDSKGTTKVLDDEYKFDANGNVTDITDSAQNGLTTRGMAYDKLDRLTAAVSPQQWGNATYAYDVVDNLKSADQGARQYLYTYDGNNRLDEIKTPSGASVWTFGYDAGGNVIRKGAQDFAFDSSNRMTTAELLDGSGVQTYRYDGTGRRVQTTDPGVTLWMYGQSGQVLYTTEARRSRNLSYIYLGNTQVATRAVAFGSGEVTVSYQHTDALGSPVAETDDTGLVTKRNSYAPYGEAYTPTTIDGTGYTGHVMDQGTGLTYMQQRYYDPQIGRFLSDDPAKASQSSGSNFNRYWYASGNPFRFSDPDGRQSCDFVCKETTAGRMKTPNPQAVQQAAQIGENIAGAGKKYTGGAAAPVGSSTGVGPLKSGYVPATNSPSTSTPVASRPGGTTAIGVTIGATAIAGLAGTIGIVSAPDGVAPFFEGTVAGPGARGDGHVGISLKNSTARSLHEFGGPSGGGSVMIGDVGYVAQGVDVGQGDNGRIVTTSTTEGGVGFGIGASPTASYTYVLGQ